MPFLIDLHPPKIVGGLDPKQVGTDVPTFIRQLADKSHYLWWWMFTQNG